MSYRYDVDADNAYSSYGYSSYESSGDGYYGYNPYFGAIYGYRNDVTDPTTGYTHVHAAYYNSTGSYDRSLDEDRGPYLDHSVQTTSTYYSGVYTTDTLDSYTPLDGSYNAYGTRDTDTYNINTHTSASNDVYFSSEYSFSDFHSYDYQTGASIASYDTRFFYAYGYNEYTASIYNGPNGYSASSGGAYHYTG